MTQENVYRKLSVLVVALLLIGGSFMFLPVGAVSPAPAATIGPQPSTVTGTTATIDYPIIAGLSTAVTRTITVSNPIGNPAITSLTISIPKAAGSAPSGAFPADSGVPVSPAPSAQTFGSGPWAIVFQAGTNSILVPGGAAIKLTISFTSESALTTTGVADAYSLSVAVLDQTGSTTNLPSITIYETSTTSPTITVPTLSTFVAGTSASFSVSGANSGLPLNVKAVGSISSTGTAASKTTKINPSTVTTTTTSASFTVNDTTAETLTVYVSGGTLNVDSANGAITNSAVVTVTAGPVSSLAICFTGIAGYTCPTQPTAFNETALSPILGSSVTISTADKFGNPVVITATGGTNVVVTAITLSGQAAGFNSSNTANAYSSAYPYTPAGGVSTSQTVNIPSGSSSTTLAGWFFFGVDWLAKSYLVASTSSSGLGTGTSIPVVTFGLLTGYGAAACPSATISPASAASVSAGSSQTVTYTLSTTCIQAGLPVYFFVTNATSPYAGTFSGAVRSTVVSTSVSSGVGSASAKLFVDTKVGRSTTASAYSDLSPVAGTANSTTLVSGLITTASGPFAQLTVTAYFDGGLANPTKAIVASGTLWIDISASDAYGNAFTPTGSNQVIQVNLAATSGALSATTVFITAGHSDTANSLYNIQFVAPSTVGTVVTMTASAVYNGLPATGTKAISVVSKTPTLSATFSPATITTGVPIVFTGWAKVSSGLAVSGVPATMALLQYSLNGAANVSAGTFSSANNQWSFSILLTAGSQNQVTLWAKDSAGNWASLTLPVPPVAPNARVIFTSVPNATTVQGNKGVGTTIMNNSPSSIQCNVYFVVSPTSAPTQQVAIYLSQITLAPGASSTQAVALLGLAKGSYTVTVFVWDASGTPASAVSTATVSV